MKNINAELSTDELSTADLKLAGEIQKRIDNTNATQLINNYEIGKLIIKAYGEQKEYGNGQIEKIAKHLGRSSKTLYAYRSLHNKFTEAQIQVLAYEKFSTPYVLLKAYGKIDADEIMKIRKEVDSLDEFKATLKARWLELKAQKDAANPEPTVDNPDSEADADTEKDSNDGIPETDGQNSPVGEFSPPPEVEPSPASTTNTEEPLFQDQNEDDKPKLEDAPNAEMAPTPDSNPKPEPDKEEPQEDENNLQASNHNNIKHSAGSATNLNPPANNDGGTLADMMGKKFPTNPSDPDDGTITIAKSRLAQLEKLEKEYSGLKARVAELEQEKKVLEQEKDDLEEKLYDLEEKLSEAQRVEEFAHM